MTFEEYGSLKFFDTSKEDLEFITEYYQKRKKEESRVIPMVIPKFKKQSIWNGFNIYNPLIDNLLNSSFRSSSERKISNQFKSLNYYKIKKDNHIFQTLRKGQYLIFTFTTDNIFIKINPLNESLIQIRLETRDELLYINHYNINQPLVQNFRINNPQEKFLYIKCILGKINLF